MSTDLFLDSWDSDHPQWHLGWDWETEIVATGTEMLSAQPNHSRQTKNSGRLIPAV